MTGERRTMACYSRFFIFLPLICVLFVFANDNQNAKNTEMKTNHTETVNKTVSELETESPEVNVAEKSLVEVTDAIEEEEEDTLAYTPAIAPATPQVLIVSPSIHADIEMLRSKIVENNNPKSEDHSASISNQKPEVNEFVVSKALIDGMDDTEVKESSISSTFTSLMIVPSEVMDPTSTTSTISTPVIKEDEIHVKTDASSVGPEEVNGDIKNLGTENVVQSNIIKNEGSNLKIAGTEGEEVYNTEERQQLPTDTDGEKSIMKEQIVDSMEKDSHDDRSKQEISEHAPGEESTHASDGVNTNGDGKLSNKEPALPEPVKQPEPVKSPEPVKLPDLSKEESRNENKVITKEEPDDMKVNISSDISSLNATGSVDMGINTVVKEVKENLNEKHKVVPVEKTEEPVDTDDKDNEGAADTDKKMLSFAEWKKRLDKEKVEEEVVDSKSTVPKNKTQKEKNKEKIKHKIRKNFASIDCGGKVVSANVEAQNSLSVLKDDKDAYMLNPCNVKAWFVVELCDRIQIDSIDLANFEMFSSTPETFNVYITSRYPSGSWEKVGTFHAGPEKQIQTFSFDEKFYGRYIKIEIKKYHGKEHYCPLSLLRVFGITEVEQFEDSEAESLPDDSNNDDSEQVPPEQDTDVNPANIFQAAKNVVADLVNGMAKKLSGKSNSELNESAITLQGDVGTSVVVTVTALAKDPVAEELNSTYYYKDSLVVGDNFVDWEMWYYYRQQKRTCSVTDYKRLIQKIKATVYFNNTRTKVQPIASVSLEPDMSQSIVVTPHVSAISKSISENNVSVSISRSEVTPSEVQKATQTIEKTGATELPSATPFLSVIPAEKPTVKLGEMSMVVTSVTSVVPNTSLNESLISTQSSDVKPIYNEDTVDVLEFKVNETVKGAVVAEKIVHNTSTEVAENQTDANITAPKSEISELDIPAAGDSYDGSPDSVPGLKEDISESTIDMVQATKISVDVEKSSPSTQPSDITIDNASTVEITSTPSAKTVNKKSDIAPDHSSEKDTQTAAKTTSGSKESIIAKLNAKVKALQANLTMSMMYLDEMSEQYRTAVAEVDNRHKKKTAALNVSIQQQQLIIKHQTNLIANLTNQINLLALQLQNLTQTTQEQHQKIIETHATWVFLEITIILIFLLLCRGKPRSYNDDIDEDDRESDHSNRRFSEPALIKGKEMWAIEKPLVRKQLSDPIGMADSTYSNNQAHSPGLSKKRKRRKGPKSNVSETVVNKCNGGDIPGSTEKAGLIFGRGLFTGLAGAFTRKKDSSTKLSRQADALLDEVTDKICDANPLRKARSSELPTIDEDKTVDTTLMERPKSCGYLNDNIVGFKKYNNKNRAAGRFG